MPRQTALVIDATRSVPTAASVRSEGMAPVRALLKDALEAHGADVDFFSPEASRLAHCIGCFACWVEHPGVCRYRDGIENVLPRVVAADIVVLLTHLAFGGYSATLKQVLERMLGLLLPDFVLADGELSHPPRYARSPRLVAVGVGIGDPIDDLDAAIFRALVGRTARNLRADGHSSTLISLLDEPDEQRAAIEAALDRLEPIPDLASIARLIPAPEPVSPAAAGVPGRVLLMVGSPRRLKRSTSSVLGERLLDGLHRAGWTSETITITTGIEHETSQATGLRWASGLSVGAGPWIDGRPLSGAGRSPLPTGRLVAGLDMAARSLARRQPIPDEAVRLAAASPIAGLPFGAWQRAYGAITGLGLRRMAAAAGIDAPGVRARPYEPTSERGLP